MTDRAEKLTNEVAFCQTCGHAHMGVRLADGVPEDCRASLHLIPFDYWRRLAKRADYPGKTTLPGRRLMKALPLAEGETA